MTRNAGDITACFGRIERRDSVLRAEAERLVQIIRSATPPVECGPDIPISPARGVFRTFAPTTIRAGSAGTLEPAGYRGSGEAHFRKAIIAADVFDVMEHQAREAHRASGSKEPFAPPFTGGQVAVARRYRELTERHEGMMRCASLEAKAVAGGGAGGEFIDAFVAEGIELEKLHRRIGGGVALAVRRVRPSKRSAAGARPIPDRAIVDRVCIGQVSLSDVLRAFGWAAKGDHRKALRLALAAALDRMQGYRPARPQHQG